MAIGGAQVGLDLGRCFKDAAEVWTKNFLILILATFLMGVISFFTLFILAGPLSGGYALMMLNAMRSADKKVKLNDMFSIFGKFLPLLGLFIIESVLVIAGIALCLIPGMLLITLWLYTFFLVVDKNTGALSSLQNSWNIVVKKGFVPNLMLAVIYLAFSAVGAFIPVIGGIFSLLLVPFAYLLLTSGYVQQVVEDKGELEIS